MIRELSDLHKPFVVLYNCVDATGAKAKDEAARLTQKYGVPVIPDVYKRQW